MLCKNCNQSRSSA